MRDPSFVPAEAVRGEGRPTTDDRPPDVTRDPKAFTAAVRARLFSFLHEWSRGHDENALELLDSRSDEDGADWTADRLKQAREAHTAGHGGLRFDPEARNLRHVKVEPSEDREYWAVEQMLLDTAGHNDWMAVVDVDLVASRAQDAPSLRLLSLGPLA